MSFTQKHIPAKTLCIIDIGSYKLRACAAKFKNKEIEILAYSEKRQDISFFANNECLNLPGLCENVASLIKIIERKLDMRFDDIVINYPFWELFVGSKQINYKRKHAHKKIDSNELIDILSSVEKLCLNHLASSIDKFYGLSQKDVQILLSRVNSISLDGKKHDKIIGQEWENMKISLLNAFIPSLKHKLITQIGSVLGKNIYRILPSEYCISKIFPQKDIIIADLWATQTTLTLKINSDIVWISKLSIWINDLVSKISKKTKERKAEIIRKLSQDDCYIEEKEDFLSIWWESIWISLSELLSWKVCPKKMYLWGGGSNNDFIKNFVKQHDFRKYDIKMVKDIQLINEDLAEVFSSMKNLKIDDIKKIPLDIYTLLHETNTIISREKDIISTCLKQAIKKLWYIQS